LAETALDRTAFFNTGIGPEREEARFASEEDRFTVGDRTPIGTYVDLDRATVDAAAPA
jgi:acyl-[acyl carrier protein]--UDP-N-acetylglucosamine O-acyltransferase